MLIHKYQQEEDFLEVLINGEDVSPREDTILNVTNQEVDILGKELEDDIHDGTFNSSENKQCEIPPLLGSADGQCDKAGQCEKAACAQIERAIQLGNDVFKSEAADLVPQKSNLLSFGQAKSISPPLKEYLSGMKSQKEDPNHHADWTDMYVDSCGLVRSRVYSDSRRRRVYTSTMLPKPFGERGELPRTPDWRTNQ